MRTVRRGRAPVAGSSARTRSSRPDFGGKDALYRALVERWLAHEADVAGPERPLADLVSGYVHDSVEQRDMQRLILCESLEDAGEPTAGVSARTSSPTCSAASSRASSPPIFDPAFVLLVLQAAASVGVSFPADVRRLTGLDPASSEFADRSASKSSGYSHTSRKPTPTLESRSRTVSRSRRRPEGIDRALAVPRRRFAPQGGADRDGGIVPDAPPLLDHQ